MKLQFAAILSAKRQQLNITQEQIANFIGVSKAAVSKWEKGQSYPDITLLPKLATFLNVSIDELLGYEAQLTKEQQVKLYSELLNRLTNEPFHEVQKDIEKLVEEYYSCFSFLLIIVQLYMNYFYLAEDKDKLFERMTSLCKRVIEQSGDIELITQANHCLASIAIFKNDPDTVIQLLGEGTTIDYGTDLLKATAWMMKQNPQKAEEILQSKSYQCIIYLITSTGEVMQFQLSQPEKLKESIHRIKQIITSYNVEHLNINAALVFYLKAANFLIMLNELDEAMVLIEDYCRACEKIQFPLELRGDEYFHLLENWIKETLQIGSQAPRDEQSIKMDLLNSIVANPTFDVLKDRKDFKGCLLRLDKLK